MLASEPVYVVTADLDWASEYCIQSLLSAFKSHAIKPAIFITHSSDVINRAKENGEINCGIHPNFLPNSSHGEDIESVIDHVLTLVPKASASRSHAYVSSSHIVKALYNAGIKYDSGPVFFMQQNLQPLVHGSGLVHFPVFWEDDCHWDAGLHWDFASWRDEFLKPGLKIINVHPFFFTLNIPNASFYKMHKSHIQTLTDYEAKKFRFNGSGCQTFTLELLQFLSQMKNNVYSLDEIYNS